MNRMRGSVVLLLVLVTTSSCSVPAQVRERTTAGSVIEPSTGSDPVDVAAPQTAESASPSSPIAAAAPEPSLPVTPILEGDEAWKGCSVSLRGGVPEALSCGEQGFYEGACVVAMRADLGSGDASETLWSCGRYIYDGCDAPRIAPVVVVTGTVPPLALGTSGDVSCGSSISLDHRGGRNELVLEGGGEDGTYRVRYALMEGELTLVGMSYEEAIY